MATNFYFACWYSFALYCGNQISASTNFFLFTSRLIKLLAYDRDSVFHYLMVLTFSSTKVKSSANSTGGCALFASNLV